MVLGSDARQEFEACMKYLMVLISGAHKHQVPSTIQLSCKIKKNMPENEMQHRILQDYKKSSSTVPWMPKVIKYLSIY
jgi:hypothetical protein